MSDLPFWKSKSLAEMSDDEWESLCDGCGQCCLHKLEDFDTGDYHVTDLSCTLLNCSTGKCLDYPNRKKHVPDCVQLTATSVYEIAWLPETCAYRLLADGKPLLDWHPLVSGRSQTVVEAGISVAGKVVPGDPSISEMTQRIQRTLAGVKPGKG